MVVLRANKRTGTAPQPGRWAITPSAEATMHIVIGLIAGSVLGVLTGSAVVQFATPPTIAVQANKAPAVTIPANRYFDI
jgi:hypothetical protein